MKLLFVCGAAFTDDTLRCPSWIRGIIPLLDSEYKVTLLSVDAAADVPRELTVGKTTVRWIPKNLWKSAELFAAVAAKESADVIVLFGTESRHSFEALQLCKAAGLLDKTVMFAQGMAKACAVHYAEGVPAKVVGHWTFRDLLRRTNIRREQQMMEARAEDERQIITTARHFIGRTTMDQAIIRMYRPDAAYYKCNDVLRGAFYEGAWQYERCKKHRIFISQYYYPLKGFHYLLEAASMLKDKYPDLVIAAAGYNPIRQSTVKKEMKDSSYIWWIKSLIRRYGLHDNIELLGELNEEQMKEEYLKANVFVLPSTIENSPNSLAEAMMLGVPCVASDVGGVSDFADHRQDAYLYPASATYLLAYYLDTLFADPAAAAQLGANGKRRAEREYDPRTNIDTLQRTFTTIAESSK